MEKKIKWVATTASQILPLPKKFEVRLKLAGSVAGGWPPREKFCQGPPKIYGLSGNKWV